MKMPPDDIRQGGQATPVYNPYHTPVLSSPSFTPIPPPPPAVPARPKNRRLIALIALLLFVLIGASIISYFVFFQKNSTSVAGAPSTVVGSAYFSSSGLLSANPDSNQGITDQLQITLKNISAPPSGKSYYAWLLNDRHMEWNPLLLGQLTVNNSAASMFYAGDAVHTNLLATNSRFFVTEEDASTTPVNPSQDPRSLVYYAEFSQTPNPADPSHFSLYDHIRHLLADDPKVKAVGLTGGLDIWLYRDTQKVLEWSGSVRDAQKTGGTAFMRRQLIRILDYLDGTYFISRDIAGGPILADPTISKIGLLTFDPANQEPPGYVYHIGKHLREINTLPESTAQQKDLAAQITQALNQVDAWFHTIRTDTLQLLKMSDKELLSSDARGILDEVAALANDAFVGQIDAQGQVRDGIVQIHYNIQRLATYTIKACTANQPCPALV